MQINQLTLESAKQVVLFALKKSQEKDLDQLHTEIWNQIRTGSKDRAYVYAVLSVAELCKQGAIYYRNKKWRYIPYQFYFIGWVQSDKNFEPISHPPNDSILGYWIQPHNLRVYALVAARSEEEAKASIKIDWPNVAEWRRIEVEDTPRTDPFTTETWMSERISKYLTV